MTCPLTIFSSSFGREYIVADALEADVVAAGLLLVVLAAARSVCERDWASERRLGHTDRCIGNIR